MNRKIVSAVEWEGVLLAFADNGDVFKWDSLTNQWLLEENIFKQVEGKE